jgi:hypothetical protein
LIRLSNPMRLRPGRIQPACSGWLRGLIGLSLGLLVPTVALADRDMSRADIEARIAYYAHTYSLPVELLRKVVRTESTFNPAARNGPYWGLMQILPQTARGLGYQGPPSGLLDAETNLIYAGAYLANAYIIAGGNSARAHSLYKGGYYYEAKRKRLLGKLIKVPMGTTPMLVAGKLVTKPTNNTMLAFAAPEPAKPLVEKKAATEKQAASETLVLAKGAEPEVVAAEAEAADTRSALVPKPLAKPVAKPVVEMAEMIVPLLPRKRPAAPIEAVAQVQATAKVQTVAHIEPIKGPVRGLLYATALVPATTTVAKADLAEQMIASPELALASTTSSFAKDATAVAFARPARSLQSAHMLPAAVRLASTDDGIRSDAPGCCQLPGSVAAAVPLPRVRPAHKAD